MKFLIGHTVQLENSCREVHVYDMEDEGWSIGRVMYRPGEGWLVDGRLQYYFPKGNRNGLYQLYDCGDAWGVKRLLRRQLEKLGHTVAYEKG